MNAEIVLSEFLDENKMLTAYPAKRKKKLWSLVFIASHFELGRVYTEKEVNDIINSCTLFGDPATIRRELFGYRFIDRKPDCTEYRLCSPQPTPLSLGIE